MPVHSAEDVPRQVNNLLFLHCMRNAYIGCQIIYLEAMLALKSWTTDKDMHRLVKVSFPKHCLCQVHVAEAVLPISCHDM